VLPLPSNFESFDSDELPSAAVGIDANDDKEGVDVDLPPPPPISLSTFVPSPPVTTTTPNPTPALDLWDEDEFEGIPVLEVISSDEMAEAGPLDPSTKAAAEGGADHSQDAGGTPPRVLHRDRLRQLPDLLRA
jgi:hypothetical protein